MYNFDIKLSKTLTGLKDESTIMPNGDRSVGYPQICIRSNRKPERTDLEAICEIADDAADKYPNDKEARAKAVVSALTQVCGGGSLGHAWIIVFESENVTDSNSHRYGYHENYGFTKNKSNDRVDRGFAFQLCMRISDSQFKDLVENVIPKLNEESTEIAKGFHMKPGKGQQGVYTPLTNCTWFAGNVWNRTMNQHVVFNQPFDGSAHFEEWAIPAIQDVKEVADPGMLSESMDKIIASKVDPLTPLNAQPAGYSEAGFKSKPKLVFSDEFSSFELDTAKWTARDQYRGKGNSGVEWWYKPENVRKAVGNDALAIDVSKIGENTYAGGRIDSQSKFDFTFGAFECRMHIPVPNGHLAAAWLQSAVGLPEEDNVTARTGAEIDVIESNSIGDEYAITLHWGGYGKYHKQSSLSVKSPRLHSTWYHTFGVLWNREKLVFTYDGKIVRTITDPDLISQVREFPILSNEIITFAQGDIRKAPLDASSTVYIDYVRIWEWEG